MKNIILIRLARVIEVSVALLLLAVAGTALAQTTQQYTIDHAVMFTAGTDTMRGQLRRTPAAREIVSGVFAIAREDLDDDGRPEFILLSQSSAMCRDGGCALLILGKTHQGIEPFLAAKVNGKLALTKEKVGGYRALAVLGKNGQIAVGNRRGSPLFGKQVVYTMLPRAQTPAGNTMDETKSDEQTESTPNTLEPNAQKVISKYLSSIPGKQESAEASGSALADLNSDGKSEIVLVWTLLGATYWHTTLTIFSHSAKGYKHLSSLPLNGLAKLSSADNGIIAIDQTMYAKNDPTCCPSIKKRVTYKWTGTKIVEIKD
ncbi:MAG: hypothetical protein H7X83_05420 [Verrucomicrobia bacterium]|nr:hypothetical protein [Deltaproteobacteria bacterium]